MKRYIWLIICLIWIVFQGGMLYSQLWHVDDDSVYTTLNDTEYDRKSDIMYVTDNIDSSGFVYAIDSDGRVLGLFDADGYANSTFCDELYYNSGNLYVLIYGNTTLDNQPVKAYSIVQLDSESFKVKKHTGWFKTYYPGDATHLSKDDKYFYVTSVANDESAGMVYAIPVESLVEATPSDDTNIRNVSTIRYSVSVEPSKGYHVVFAAYENGQMSTMENGNGVISDTIYNPIAAKRFNNMRFNVGQILTINKISVRFTILITIAGLLFIIALNFFVRQRNRVAYLIVCWEIILFFALGCSVLGLYRLEKHTNWDEVVKFASFTLDDVRSDLDILEAQYENTEHYYRTEDYRNICDRLRRVVKNYANGNVFDNAVSIAISGDDYHIVAAAKGLDNCNLEEAYGTEAVELAKNVHEYGKRQTGGVTIDGVNYTLVCVGKKGETNPTSVLMASINSDGSDELVFSSSHVVYAIAVFLFVAGSIAGIYILIRQAKDLRILGNTMMDVSQGGVGIKKPDTLGEDMFDMWSGLLDIDRSFKNLNYIKYRTFEAYYRFAPKSVERLLGKTSITEVASGDMVEKNGTVILIRTNVADGMLKNYDGDNNLAKFDAVARTKSLLEFISKLQEENRAYKISSVGDFNDIELVAPDNVYDASRIGIDICSNLNEEGSELGIFMDYVDYKYGVTIAGEEATQYLISREMRILRNNLELLHSLKIPMVVTGKVLEREFEKPSNRYIGYWNIEDGIRVELYEILDACKNDQRHLKEDTKVMFERGINLFYKGDYYQARNILAQVIKVNYDDNVARWYLFTCEKYLDGSGKEPDYSLSK